MKQYEIRESAGRGYYEVAEMRQINSWLIMSTIKGQFPTEKKAMDFIGELIAEEDKK